MPASTRGAKRPRSGSDIVTSPSARVVLAVLRIVVGFIFLWTFLDKTFGLGFSTPRQMAWINGGQPAQGFIKGVAVNSPFGSAFAASALMVSLYLALWPIGTGGTENAATNPLVDLHWVLTLSAILFALTRAGDTLGLGTWWSRLVGDSWLR